MGNYVAARQALERALPILEKGQGLSNPDIGQTLSALALVVEALGDPGLAETYFKRALAIQEKALEPADPTLAETRKGYVALLRQQHRDAEAAAVEARP